MKLLLLLGYFFFSQEEIVDPVTIHANEEELALPVPAAATEVEGVKIEISIDALGHIEAQAGVKKLAKFAPNQKAGMKPLDDWMTQIGKEELPVVALRVDGEARNKVMIDLLNLLAQKGVTQITFATLPDPKKEN